MPISTPNDELFTTVSATFDGYEGGYFLFTKENEDPIGKFDLKNAHAKKAKNNKSIGFKILDKTTRAHRPLKPIMRGYTFE